MTIVFCFTKILRNSHRDIFQLDRFQKEGHDIHLLDLTSIYGAQSTCDDPYMLDLTWKCSNEADIKVFRNGLREEPVIYVCNDSYLMFAYDSFKLLMREQDKLLAFRIKPSPFQFAPDNLVKRILRKLFTQVSWLPYSLRSLYLLFRTYYAPDYYMCTTHYDLPLKALITVKKKNIYVVHSDDANRIVEDRSEMSSGERIGVFLDQILPVAYREIAPERFVHYYERLSKTLKELKDHLDLDRIVIAEHPESVAAKEVLEDKYEDFDRVVGDTQRLVKNATYVFAHFSTSIGLAAYYRKPVVLLIDKDIAKVDWIKVAVNTYKKFLGLPVVDMVERNFLPIDNIRIQENLYRDYVRKFIKDNDRVKENSYHFVIDNIIDDIDKHRTKVKLK